MTEKEKFEAWRKDQEENHGLIELRVYPQGSFLSADPKLIGDALSKIDEEEYYKELNSWNHQLDTKEPRILYDSREGIYASSENKEEAFYKELNEFNQAIEDGKFEEIKFL